MGKPVKALSLRAAEHSSGERLGPAVLDTAGPIADWFVRQPPWHPPLPRPDSLIRSADGQLGIALPQQGGLPNPAYNARAERLVEANKELFRRLA